jgi:acyl transferase domain-containing protein
MAQIETDKVMPIAIVGLGCRFPGRATSPEDLWDVVIHGESTWSEFPKDRINIESYFHPSGTRQGSVRQFSPSHVRGY